jgi:hypothetical protein
MNVLIMNYDALNPLAHEWAHILNDGTRQITLINHRSSIVCRESELEVIDISEIKRIKNRPFEVMFLPWLPSRKFLVTTFLVWLNNGRPNVFWIDHNPATGRDREGLILRVLRRNRSTKVRRLVHTGNTRAEYEPVIQAIPHPVFSHAFENLKKYSSNQKKERLTISFIGRLDDQKGLNSLPRIAHLISNALGKPTYWNISGNNPNIDYVKAIIQKIEEIPNVVVESHIYGKNCPDELIYKALVTSHFLIAPYNRITASGTFALALACSTQIVCLGETEPLGLQPFLGKSIHCIDESQLIQFLQTDEFKKIMPNVQKNDIASHNKNCHDQFFYIVNATRKNH